MSVTTPELIVTRREEIINACEELYQSMSFKEITIKEIGNVTSFGRTSIYNYFQTKEEIFLALLQREYNLWTCEMNGISENELMTRDELAKALAYSLEKRALMLKLLAMNLYDIEENSSHEKLVEFKCTYKKALEALEKLLTKHCTAMSDNDRKAFIYALFPFMFGVYPYTFATPKQAQAMDEIGFDYPRYTIYELVYDFISKQLR